MPPQADGLRDAREVLALIEARAEAAHEKGLGPHFQALDALESIAAMARAALDPARPEQFTVPSDGAQVRQDHLYVLLVSAVRYALGRQTSAVSDVCGCVRSYGRHLRAGELGVLIRDIEEHGDYAERQGRDRARAYGADFDYRDWMDLLVWLRAAKEAAEGAALPAP